MTTKDLLIHSTAVYDVRPSKINHRKVSSLFRLGAEWMYDRLNWHLGPEERITFNSSANYTAYGIGKYGLSLLLSAWAFYGLLQVHFLLSPAAILVFYLVEIHFLFLFPLLIEKSPSPILESVKLTYKVGIIKSLTRVITIAAYMLLGILINPKDPYRKWHIGCIAIVIWYADEVRNR